MKSNIGHAEAASGMTQLAKVLLQLRHRKLVPTIKPERVNPKHVRGLSLPAANGAVGVGAAPSTRERGRGDPRRATVSSFGAGGANAHLILEEYEASAPRRAADDGEGEPQLIVVSAMTAERLRVAARRLREHVTADGGEDLADLAYTLQIGREEMDLRLAVVARDRADGVAGLDEYLKEGEVTSALVVTGDVTEESAGIGVLLSGRGADTVVRGLIAERDLEGLAVWWAHGGRVPWEALHANGGRGIVALPTYPFCRDPYWLAPPDLEARPAPRPAVPAERDSGGTGRSVGTVRRCSGGCLGISPEKISSRKPLTSLGFTSIHGITLKQLLEQQLGVEIPMSSIARDQTLEELEQRLQRHCVSGPTERNEERAPGVGRRPGRASRAVPADQCPRVLRGGTQAQVRRGLGGVPRVSGDRRHRS